MVNLLALLAFVRVLKKYILWNLFRISFHPCRVYTVAITATFLRGESMRLVIAVLSFLCVSISSDAATTVVTNQPPPHAGWEVSQDVPLPPRQAETRFFKAEITFTSTASNNVQMAFGSDVDNDGKLPAEETVATFGWDRGAWFILSGDLLQKFTCIPQDASTATNRTLRMSARLSADGTPIGLSFRDGNGTPLAFPGLEGIPSWIRPTLWDTAALTARGWDDRDEGAEGLQFDIRQLRVDNQT